MKVTGEVTHQPEKEISKFYKVDSWICKKQQWVINLPTYVLLIYISHCSKEIWFFESLCNIFPDKPF